MDKSLGSLTRCGTFDMDLCVPRAWDEETVLEFAEEMNQCGPNTDWVLSESRACGHKKGFKDVVVRSKRVDA